MFVSVRSNRIEFFPDDTRRFFARPLTVNYDAKLGQHRLYGLDIRPEFFVILLDFADRAPHCRVVPPAACVPDLGEAGACQRISEVKVNMPSTKDMLHAPFPANIRTGNLKLIRASIHDT